MIPKPLSGLKNRHGFTLLEILMVVLVIAIASAVLVPEAMNAVEGSHMRAGLENVITVNRYARSRALLDKRPYAVLYHGDTKELELVALPARQETPAALDMMQPPPRDPATEGIPDTSTVEPVRKKALHTSLEITDVKGAQREQDSWFVVYTESGMTDPHRVSLTGANGRTTHVQIQGITGEISIHE